MSSAGGWVFPRRPDLASRCRRRPARSDERAASPHLGQMECGCCGSSTPLAATSPTSAPVTAMTTQCGTRAGRSSGPRPPSRRSRRCAFDCRAVTRPIAAHRHAQVAGAQLRRYRRGDRRQLHVSQCTFGSRARERPRGGQSSRGRRPPVACATSATGRSTNGLGSGCFACCGAAALETVVNVPTVGPLENRKATHITPRAGRRGRATLPSFAPYPADG